MAGGLLRITTEFTDHQSVRYRLTSVLVGRNGASCRIQALERAPWQASSNIVASLDAVADLPAFDLRLPPPPGDPDWVVLLRLLNKASR
jgi:hypothetical protein